MRIDLLITGLGMGGAETQVVALAEGLQHRGHSVRVISLITPQHFVSRLQGCGVSVHALDMKSPLSLFLALFRLWRLLRQSPPDILHAHMVHANLLARIARVFAPGLRLICTAHNLYEGGRFREWAYRFTDRLSTLNTAVGQATLARYVQERIFRADNSRVVHNGIDLDVFYPREHRLSANAPEPTAQQPFGSHADQQTDASPFTWLAVGRLVEQKDYPTLLRALARLQSKNWQLKIAGQGHLKAVLQDLVVSLNLSERVQFLGVCHDMPALYRSVDAFVLSSVYEGYGLVVAEAMACALPVVCTDCGGPGEILAQSESRESLVPVGDVDALARQMDAVMRLSDLDRKRLGEANCLAVQRQFSLHSILDQWEEIYRTVRA